MLTLVSISYYFEWHLTFPVGLTRLQHLKSNKDPTGTDYAPRPLAIIDTNPPELTTTHIDLSAFTSFEAALHPSE